MIPSPRTIAAGLVLALIVGAYFLGRRHEANAHAIEMAQIREALFEASEMASRKEAERLIVQNERDRLAQELENEARTDGDAGRVALPARVLRRLDAR